ncbi:MAG: integrase arm-type DNA-binding domain-containing protein [Gammaproteobacteria bacterium]|nr:integrase arm-type DNA-binding domain-containing protein [Gammaproteobacteria bacterium]
MARVAKPLTDTQCAKAKAETKIKRLYDGNGLLLQIKPNGSKIWQMRFTKPDGRGGMTSLGPYPAMSLSDARKICAEYHALLAQDIDPVEHKKSQNEEAIKASTHTLEKVARRWHQVASAKWNKDHAVRVMRRLEMHLFPALGTKPVSSLKTRDFLPVLKRLEDEEKYDVASRLQQNIVNIMRYAVQLDIIDSNPAHDLQGLIAAPRAKHRPALELKQLPDFLARVQDYDGRPLTRMALEFALLTFVRSSEWRFARWNEFDLKNRVWTIPASREPIEGVKFSSRGSKMRTEHLVPLSNQAYDLLFDIQTLTGDFELVFAGDHYQWKPMSDGTINKALQRMKYDTKTELSGHGFRAMACSALIESGLFSRDAIERQMSHQERNGVRAAYIHKAEHWEERQKICQWWADYLEQCRTEYMTPYEFSAQWEQAA